MKKALYIVIIVILLGVFGVSAYMVGSYLIENKQQQDMYGDLAAIKDQAKPTTEATEPTEETYDPNAPMETIPIHNEDGILLEYEGLYEMNPSCRPPWTTRTSTCTGILRSSRLLPAASTSGRNVMSTNPAIM